MTSKKGEKITSSSFRAEKRKKIINKFEEMGRHLSFSMPPIDCLPVATLRNDGLADVSRCVDQYLLIPTAPPKDATHKKKMLQKRPHQGRSALQSGCRSEQSAAAFGAPAPPPPLLLPFLHLVTVTTGTSVLDSGLESRRTTWSTWSRLGSSSACWTMTVEPPLTSE